ncbi:MAG: hypothetical protein SOY61_06415 [Campylobacter sp.]|nr:hypothetical protein [Campylobacter sp.]
MTEQTRAVFENPELLREKLAIFLRKPEKVEIYAKAAEKFFSAGGRQKLKYTSTWSWWGFFGALFGAPWFFLYRKIYVIFFVALAALWIGRVIFSDIFMPGSSDVWLDVVWQLIFAITCAQLSKFTVIDRFSKALDSDELENKGGVNPWGIYIPIGIIVIYAIYGFIIGFIEGFNNAMP